MFIRQQIKMKTQLFLYFTPVLLAIKALQYAVQGFHLLPLGVLSGLQNSGHCLGNALPVGAFTGQLFSPGSGQPIEFSAAIVF